MRLISATMAVALLAGAAPARTAPALPRGEALTAAIKSPTAHREAETAKAHRG